jgi:serine/threonine protein kinase
VTGAPASEPANRAERLAGLVLNNRWVVIEQLSRGSDDTGGSRSVCYRATSTNGQAAFVKAFDFHLDADTKKLQRNVSEFNHERDLHEYCLQLDRVTQIYDHGLVQVDGYSVHFLVCEYADRSFRSYHPPGDETVPASERLCGLKKIALALLQLHDSGVAHQDLKPSNAVHFDDERIKITDLGSASCRHLSAPHDADILVGQPIYAPYELLYRSPQDAWERQRRRFGCDAFLLGNLIFTVFSGASLSTLLLHAIPEPMWPTTFDGSYNDVMDVLVANHFALTREVLSVYVPEVVLKEVSSLVLSLCHPDPAQRGLGKGFDRGERQLDLRRCIGTLNTLANKAELYERRTQRKLAAGTA